jgi:hypothetical protein
LQLSTAISRAHDNNIADFFDQPGEHELCLSTRECFPSQMTKFD